MTTPIKASIPQSVYYAFNLSGDGEKILGGQNNSYRFGNIILKKNDGDNTNIDYISEILNEISSRNYRIAKPVISNKGSYLEDGYIAAYYEEGHHIFDNIKETIRISKIFHKDIANYRIDRMQDANTQWSIAMDIIFRQRAIPNYVDSDNLKICLKLINKLELPKDKLQIIHGDIGGNILYHNNLPPCIIDFSPLIAPSKMAEAIALVDYAAWVKRNTTDIENLLPFDEYKIFIQCAVLFRLLSALCKNNCSKEEFNSEYTAYIKIWDYVSDITNCS